MHVQLVDPAAYTPPYDHALASALGRAGATVDLITTASPEWDAATTPDAAKPHRVVAGTDAPATVAAATAGAVQVAAPPALLYTRQLDFYRRGAALPARWRQLSRVLQHPAGMRRLRARPADVTHLQWAPLQEFDRFGLPRNRPLVITAHDILPREARHFQRAAQKAIYHRADRVIAHSAHGRERLIDEAGIDPARINVIPHGAFEHLATGPRAPLPEELVREAGNDRPVVLSFGLIRPYKGTDLLLRAWREVQTDAELWIVGRPRGVSLAELRTLADDRVRFVPRFVTDGELAACFGAAAIAVLPYREIEQSGVLAAALAFGTPVLASAVGAFPEAEALGAATTVPAGDVDALAAGLDRLLGDPTERATLSVGARRLATGAWSWDAVAQQHLAVYEEIVR